MQREVAAKCQSCAGVSPLCRAAECKEACFQIWCAVRWQHAHAWTMITTEVLFAVTPGTRQCI